MKKSAIALAVAAALGMSATSQAETVLYGSARVSIDWQDEERAFDNDASFWDVVNNSSRLGVRGFEDLGNGLSAIYLYEFGVDVQGGNQYFNSDRPRYVGLKHDSFGTLTLGTLYTPYYNVLGITDTLNSGKSFGYFLGGDEIFGSPTGLQVGLADVRTGSSVHYASPDIFGLNFEALVQMDGDDDLIVNADGEVIEDDNPDSIDRWEANVTYENAGIFVGGAYIQDERTEDEQWGASLGYLSDVWGLVGSYQLFLPNDSQEAIFVANALGDILGVAQNAKDDTASYTIQGTFAFGSNALFATYNYTDPDAGDFDELQYIELGLQHNLSNRTRLWVEWLYGKQEAEVELVDDTEVNVVSVGMRHDF